MDGKVVIITGANSGIGKATAIDLAKRGARIYLACRDRVRGIAASQAIIAASANTNVFLRELDLASFRSIRTFVEGFRTEEWRLDVLINNAGYLGDRRITVDGFEMHFAVNHLGHFLLTNLLLEMLQRSAPSRIVVVSSALHNLGELKRDDLDSQRSFSRLGAYAQSKLANILFGRELSRRLAGTGVTVNSLHPGIVQTDIFRDRNCCTKLFYGCVAALFHKSPEAGAQTTIMLAVDPALESVTGKYFSDRKVAKESASAQSDHDAAWLWQESLKLTKFEEIDAAV